MIFEPVKDRPWPSTITAGVMIPPGLPLVAIEALVPDPENAREHPEDEIRALVAGILEFGFMVPVVIRARDDGRYDLIAGHGRVEAAGKRIGMTAVPFVSAEHLTERQIRAYKIADNKLPLMARWNEATLADALGEIRLDYPDIRITGFSEDDLAGLKKQMEAAALELQGERVVGATQEGAAEDEEEAGAEGPAGGEDEAERHPLTVYVTREEEAAVRAVLAEMQG